MPQVRLPSGTAFWLETILPGVFGALLAYPLLPLWARMEIGVDGTAGFLAIALLIGLSLHVLRMPLTEVAMGLHWFGPLARLRRRLIARIQRAADSALPARMGASLEAAARIDLWKKRRFLDALPAGPSGTRVAYCPTLVGNAYIALAIDIGQAAEVALHGNPNAAWLAQASLARAWFDFPKEVRADITEISAGSIALLRLSVIAGALTLVYAVRTVVPGGAIWTDLSLGVASAVTARVAYTAGVAELVNFMSTIRALFMAWDRDTVQAARKIIEELRAQAEEPEESS